MNKLLNKQSTCLDVIVICWFQQTPQHPRSLRHAVRCDPPHDHVRGSAISHRCRSRHSIGCKLIICTLYISRPLIAGSRYNDRLPPKSANQNCTLRPWARIGHLHGTLRRSSRRKRRKNEKKTKTLTAMGTSAVALVAVATTMGMKKGWWRRRHWRVRGQGQEQDQDDVVCYPTNRHCYFCQRPPTSLSSLTHLTPLDWNCSSLRTWCPNTLAKRLTSPKSPWKWLWRAGKKRATLMSHQGGQWALPASCINSPGHRVTH